MEALVFESACAVPFLFSARFGRERLVRVATQWSPGRAAGRSLFLESGDFCNEVFDLVDETWRGELPKQDRFVSFLRWACHLNPGMPVTTISHSRRESRR
jgi:hypothetical protein